MRTGKARAIRKMLMRWRNRRPGVVTIEIVPDTSQFRAAMLRGGWEPGEDIAQRIIENARSCKHLDCNYKVSIRHGELDEIRFYRELHDYLTHGKPLTILN